MTSWWIALFFSTTGLLSPPTAYVSVEDGFMELQMAHHTFAVTESTRATGDYLSGLGEMEMKRSYDDRGKPYFDSYGFAATRTFRGKEQKLTLPVGKPVSLVAKPGAPYQWVSIAIDAAEFSTNTLIGMTSQPIDARERFAISVSSSELVGYALTKKAATGLGFRIYKANEYVAQDAYGYKFTPQ